MQEADLQPARRLADYDENGWTGGTWLPPLS